MSKVEGEITSVTILKQCERMSNDEIFAFFEWQPRTNGYYIIVRREKLNVSDIIYSNKHWNDQESASFAEILKDLIKIEHEYAGDDNEH